MRQSGDIGAEIKKGKADRSYRLARKYRSHGRSRVDISSPGFRLSILVRKVARFFRPSVIGELHVDPFVLPDDNRPLDT